MSLSEVTIEDILKSGPHKIGPISIVVVEANPLTAIGNHSFQADLLLQVEYGNSSSRFIGITKRTSSRRVVQESCVQAITFSSVYNAPPMIIVPYLDEEQLKEINESFPQISAVDLCGNALIKIPGELFIYSSGQPNIYPNSRPIKKIYQGASALVSRLFLTQPDQKSVSAVQHHIESLGGKISISAVSKVLSQLKEDLIVINKDGGLRLFDPLALLNKLKDNYSAPASRHERSIKLKGPLVNPDSIPGILSKYADIPKDKFCLTGASSFNNYGAGAVEPTLSFYFSGNVTELLNKICQSGEFECTEDDIFPNARILETDDQSVFFDSRPFMNSLAASPTQCYLELMNGDKRQQEGAQQVKDFILQELAEFIEELK